MRLTLRVADLGASGGTVDSGAVVIRDTAGGILARAAVRGGVAISSGGVGVVTVTLERSASASQAGARIDWNLSVRDGSRIVHALADTLMLP